MGFQQLAIGIHPVEAALQLQLQSVPCLRVDHLSPAEIRAYMIADNKIALNAGWDEELLGLELKELQTIDPDLDLELTGFSIAEVDHLIDSGKPSEPNDPADDRLPEDLDGPPRCRLGDIFRLGNHRLICGDARDRDVVAALMDGERAQMVFTDPPYNVPIQGHVSGLGRFQHDAFAMGVGEMSKAQFTDFLRQTLGAMVGVTKDGAIGFVCMDWRHLSELLAAGESIFSELKNLCVWNKTNAGMGSFYRSKHELVLVYKIGTAQHTNSFKLGGGGRYRTNVWDYAGVSSIGAARTEALTMHPTVKPVALVADALRDCSRRGEIVLDGFGGSGSTLIAAQTCGRKARLIELDPLYCDTIIRRYESLTGKAAVLEDSCLSFEAVRELRAAEVAP